jgi:hypothetical protein
MSQIEACVSGREHLGFCCSEAEYRRKRAVAIAVMLSLSDEVALNGSDPDSSDAAPKAAG